jgi:hypothetical protein
VGAAVMPAEGELAGEVGDASMESGDLRRSCAALVLFGTPHDRVRIIEEPTRTRVRVAPTDQRVEQLVERGEHICLVAGRHPRNLARGPRWAAAAFHTRRARTVARPRFSSSS